MTMIRPPLLKNLTAEDALLAGIGNAWRRELLRFCSKPRTRRELQREYLFTHLTQIIPTLKVLIAAGWLTQQGNTYRLNPHHIHDVIQLVESLFNAVPGVGEPDDALLDASIAALRRESCRQVLYVLQGEEMSTLELATLTGLTRKQVYYAGQVWTRVGVLQERPDTTFRSGNRYRRTGAALPPLGGFIHRLAKTVDI